MKTFYTLLCVIIMFAFTLSSHAQNKIRTLSYHQITKFTETQVIGQDWQHVLSDNANKIVWFKQSSPKKVFVMNRDGSGMQEIVDMGTERLSYVDISADGTKIVYRGGPFSEGSHVNFINSNGTGNADLVGFTGLHVQTIKISGDGNHIFFNLFTNSSYLAGGTAERGVYYITPGGTGLSQIVGPASVAPLLGISASDVGVFYGAGSGPCVDVSYDGSRIIFVAKDNANGGYYVFTSTGSGGSITKVHGPVTYMGGVGISKDGEKIAFTTNTSDGNREGWVANFDGSNKIKVADNLNDFYFTDGNSQGDAINLTSNGSLVMFDGYLAHLFDSDGSSVIQLNVPTIGEAGNPLIASNLSRATMSSDGSSILYSFREPGSGLMQLAMLYINPASIQSSPGISDIGTDGNAVAISPPTPSTITARLTYANGSDSLRYIGNSVLMDGRSDIKVTFRTFYDDGSSAGDVTANDMLFTHNNVVPYSDAVPGPRTLRINAEIIDDSGYIHGTAVDVEPFYVVADTSFLGITKIDGIKDGFALEQNYPNPFNASTNIKFYVEDKSNIRLDVFNAIGELQATLINNEMAPGSYQLTWDGQNNLGQKLASGMYFFRMQSDKAVQSKEFIITR